MSKYKELTGDTMDKNNQQDKLVLLTGENKDVFEFECSSGYILKVLANHGCKVVGVELDEDDAVVTKNIPSYSVAVGIPAKVIKRFDFKKNKWQKTKWYNKFMSKII